MNKHFKNCPTPIFLILSNFLGEGRDENLAIIFNWPYEEWITPARDYLGVTTALNILLFDIAFLHGTIVKHVSTDRFSKKI